MQTWKDKIYIDKFDQPGSLYKVTSSAWFDNRNYELKSGLEIKARNECIEAFDNPIYLTLLYPLIAPNSQTCLFWRGQGVAEKKRITGVYECSSYTAECIVPFPKLYAYRRLMIGLRCVLEVYNEEKFKKYAINWIDNKDRSSKEAIEILTNFFSISLIESTSSSVVNLCAAKNILEACVKFGKPMFVSDNQEDIISDVSRAICHSLVAAHKANKNINLVKIAQECLEH